MVISIATTNVECVFASPLVWCPHKSWGSMAWWLCSFLDSRKNTIKINQYSSWLVGLYKCQHQTEPHTTRAKAHSLDLALSGAWVCVKGIFLVYKMVKFEGPINYVSPEPFTAFDSPTHSK